MLHWFLVAIMNTFIYNQTDRKIKKFNGSRDILVYQFDLWLWLI